MYGNRCVKDTFNFILNLNLYVDLQKSNTIKCNKRMNQITQLPIQSVIKNLADSVALQFNLLSKKCVNAVKSKLENLQNQRLKRRESLLLKYKSRIEQKQRQQDQTPIKLIEIAQNINVEETETQESRLARINRIKQAMSNKIFESIPDSQNQKESDQLGYGISLNIVFHHFFQELKPQILGKYPSALPEKVNKVILQKWISYDQARKQAYIKKIKKKLELHQKKKKQESDVKPQAGPQIVQQKNNQREVKTQQASEQLKSKRINNSSEDNLFTHNQMQNFCQKQHQEFQQKGKDYQVSIQKQALNQTHQFVREIQQNNEPKSAIQ